jgi:hypothetical protein
MSENNEEDKIKQIFCSKSELPIRSVPKDKNATFKVSLTLVH